MLSGIPLILVIAVSIGLIVLMCASFKLNPFLALLIASIFVGVISGMDLLLLVESIQSGFGSIMRYIALIVVTGSVIGVFLERSGGAMRIAQFIVQLAGKKRSVASMSIIGAIISIPVFCDSGFILLSGLSSKVSRLSNQNKAGLTLALATGLYTTHTLVPPTPGPLAAAGNLGASSYLGTMILMGIAVSVPVLIISQFFSKRLATNLIPQIDSADDEVEEMNLPPLWKSFAPIFIPILLIAFGTILPFVGIEHSIIVFFGNPLIALLIGVFLCFAFLRPLQSKTGRDYIEDAVKISGPILIITGAGGAFGGVLRATELSNTVSTWMGSGVQSEILVLSIVFFIAAVLKTAQGSSTSAMVISSSLLAPLIPILGWESPMDFSLAIIAIGGGAMTVSHFNDSYFWVVSKFGKIDHNKTYRSFSLITGIMGFSILIITIFLVWIL